MFTFLESAGKVIKAKQPISTTGIIPYIYSFAKGFGSGDIIYSNLSFKPLDTEDNSLRQGIAVYFVHGTADQPGAFEKIARRLLAASLPRYISSIQLIALDHRYQGKGNRHFAKQLIEKIKNNGHSHVVLIGHSRGGLIIAEAAEHWAAQAGIKVHFLLSICSPFGGSYWARKPLSWVSTSIAQMEVNSGFLRFLGEKISHSSLNYYFVTASEDCIVHARSTFVKGYTEKHPGSRLILDRHGHLSILSSKRLVKFIYLKLKSVEKELYPDPSSEENWNGFQLV